MPSRCREIQLLGKTASGFCGVAVSVTTTTRMPLSRSIATNWSNSVIALCWISAGACPGNHCWKALEAAVSGLKPKETGRTIKIEEVVCFMLFYYVVHSPRSTDHSFLCSP